MFDTHDFNQYLNAIQTRLDDYSDNMKSNQQKFDSMVDTLTQLVSSYKDTDKPETSTFSVIGPNTASPHLTDQPICEPYVKYLDNSIDDTVQGSLEAFIVKNEANFVTIGDCRDTLSLCGHPASMNLEVSFIYR